MAVATLHGCPDHDVTVSSIPRFTGQEEHQATADDGALDMEQLARAASANGGRGPLSKGEIENGTAFVPLDSATGEVAGKVADIEDIYWGEDGSNRCTTIWKPSSIAMESLVDEQMQRRREGVRGRRRGHQEVQKDYDQAAIQEEMKVGWFPCGRDTIVRHTRRDLWICSHRALCMNQCRKMANAFVYLVEGCFLNTPTRQIKPIGV